MSPNTTSSIWPCITEQAISHNRQATRKRHSNWTTNEIIYASTANRLRSHHNNCTNISVLPQNYRALIMSRNFAFFVYFTLLVVLLVTCVSGAPAELRPQRTKREFGVLLDASYEEKIGADLSAVLEGNIWRNEAGNARLDGTATYSQHLDNSYGSATSGLGNARVAASIRFRFDWLVWWWQWMYTQELPHTASDWSLFSSDLHIRFG